jgi:hypothetical protein
MRAASDRIAACWYATGSFTIDVNITDASRHRIALYFLDWSALGRIQTIDVLDAATGTVLDTRTLSSFTAGQYLIWNITGHVRFRLTCRGGPNAIVNGMFFDGATPLAWNVSLPGFIAGGNTTFDLATTLPSSVARGGVFTVSSSGHALPSGMTLSPSGILSVNVASSGQTTGVIFSYQTP